LTFGMGAHGWCSSSCSCCICQWTVQSIDDCCTLMATILTWVLTGFYASRRERKWSGKRFSKIFFFPAFACTGKKENSAVKTALFRCFFFIKFYWI
jgi:hypothetical protein